jgi:hypothetical protein
MLVTLFYNRVETKNKIGRDKRSYQKSGEEENTDSNDEMGFLPFQENHRINVGLTQS